MKTKLGEEVEVKNYTPTDKEKEVQEYVDRRILELKKYRQGLKIEDDWKEADKEYVPSEIELKSRKRLEQDQDTGKRSKMVTVGGDEEAWRSNISDPILLAKIQSAISIIIDRDPRATMTALIKKFEKTSFLANGLWKRNWEISNSKQIIKLFAFDLAKYGWAAARTYPSIIKYKKSIMIEYDEKNPEKSKYEDRELIWYNDVRKQRLDPYRTWIDELTRPYDNFTMNDCYYEIDFSYDAAKVEFGLYPNFENIGESAMNVDMENWTDEQKAQSELERKDIITFGFYENRLKDLYVIYVPSKKIVLYHGALPNDDGLLSIWQAPWILRDSNSPYGISLWKTIKSKKELYDKMMNMTMDQLVLSIYKMFFYTGTTDLFGDGKIKIEPGKGKQLGNGGVNFLEVPGPGKDAWEGLQFLKSGMDDDSGITPTLEGELTGKTLGEITYAKEASLKRLKVPVENISFAIEQDAYLALSWMKQIYSTPEIKSFTDEKELADYENEMGVNHNDIFATPNQETGEIDDGLKASFYPELSLHLDENGGKLYESKESKYFQIGKDIKIDELGWKGLIKVDPTSILSLSEELEKQGKAEIFNILVPVLQLPPEIYYKPSKQLLKSRNEDPIDWLPDTWLALDSEGGKEPLFIDNPALQSMNQMMGGEGGQTMQQQAGTSPSKGGQTVVPNAQTAPVNMQGGAGNIQMPQV